MITITCTIENGASTIEYAFEVERDAKGRVRLRDADFGDCAVSTWARELNDVLDWELANPA